MKYIAMLIGFIILFANCAQGPAGQNGGVGPQGAPATSPQTIQSAIQTMVDTQNAYRNSLGQESLMPGLTCTLYTVPNTTTTIIGAVLTTIGSWNYIGVFDQPEAPVTIGFNVLPAALQSVYQTWFIAKCTGYFVVSDDNWHQFSLTSDDGSNLYVNGLTVSNDGLHAAQTVSASKYLSYGFYSFELDFLQGTGSQELVLSYDGVLLDNTHFYH